MLLSFYTVDPRKVRNKIHVLGGDIAYLLSEKMFAVGNCACHGKIFYKGET